MFVSVEEILSMHKIVAIISFIFIFTLPLFAQTPVVIPPDTTSKAEADTVRISVVDNVIHLSNAPVGSKMEIFSILGVKVYEVVIRMPIAEYRPNISKGYYIVRIKNRVKKIMIR